MVEGLMQAYHVSLKEAMQVTLPQIIMLNHGAWYNQKRAEESVKNKHEHDGSSQEEAVCEGKPLEDQNSDAWARYYTNWN